MKLSHVLAVLVVCSVSGCDGDPAGPGAIYGRYHLISLLGETPPIHFGSTEIDPFGNPTGVMCQETLYSQYVELQKPSALQMVTDFSRACDGRPFVRDMRVQTGTFAQSGDTVTMRVQIGGLLGTHTFSALKEGRRLTVRLPVYTEADPDGTSGTTYVHSVYEAR